MFLFGKKKNQTPDEIAETKQELSSDNVIQMMPANAEVSLNAGKPERAHVDRDGIFDACHTNLSPKDFYKQLEILIANCTNGSTEIPQDARKASFSGNIIRNFR